MSADAKIIIAWLLFIPLIAYNIRAAFLTYRADAKLWKLAAHIAVLVGFGVLIADLGNMVLRMKEEQDMGAPIISSYSHPRSLEHPPAAQAAPKAAPAKKPHGR